MWQYITDIGAEVAQSEGKMLKPVTYTLPAYWASYLINGDDSGLEDGEREQINAWLEHEDLPDPVSCSDESWFAWKNDATIIGGDVMDYTFLIDE